jgi:hypothetical protein
MHWCCEQHGIRSNISQFNSVVHLMGYTAKIHRGVTRNVVHWFMLVKTLCGGVVCLI